MTDVGIRQQQEFGVRLECAADPLVYGPQFAGPAGRQRRTGYHFDRLRPTVGGRRLSYDSCCVVLALVVHHDDAKSMRAALRQQGTNRRPNDFRLIAGGNNYRNDARNLRGRHLGYHKFSHPPEIAMRNQQVNPCAQANQAGHWCKQMHASSV